MSAFQIPADYGYVVLSLGVLGLVQLIIGGKVMSHRKAFSSPEFLENPKVKALQEEHKKSFGAAINNNGYPDMGSGLYSHLLPYQKWVEFNNAQRAHYNMIEQSGPLSAAIVGVGLIYPKATAGLSILYSVGRIIYAWGYGTKKGADGRLVGAIVAEVALVAIYGMGIYIGVTQTDMVECVKKLF